MTLLDDPDETVLATVTPPTLEPVEEEIETETELVGEGEEAEGAEAAEAEGDTGEEAEQSAFTSPEALLVRTGRLADRRPRQPGGRYAGRRTTSASRSPTR